MPSSNNTHPDNLEIPRLQLDRTSLKEQTAELLRHSIITGKIPSGTKLVEREVAERFGISRAPARDALMQLEKEGLVVSKPDARYVIELADRDIIQLHQVRNVLETLAAQLAANNSNPTYRDQQRVVLDQMEQAVVANDAAAFAKADLDGHTLVWQQAENPHLKNTLHTMIGPIFMFMANSTEYYDWHKTLELHRDLVNSINSGNPDAASESIRRHLDNSLERSLGVLEQRTKNRDE